MVFGRHPLRHISWTRYGTKTNQERSVKLNHLNKAAARGQSTKRRTSIKNPKRLFPTSGTTFLSISMPAFLHPEQRQRVRSAARDLSSRTRPRDNLLVRHELSSR